MSSEIQNAVRKIFQDYLEANGQRKTAERFAILEEIYGLSHHFDVDLLFNHMKQKGFSMSLATVYNTLELLEGCALIKRHQFGKNTASFEKSHTFGQHDHLICQDCKHVFEFCDPRIQQIQSMMGDILKFDITHHSLNLYGRCRDLLEKGDCKKLHPVS